MREKPRGTSTGGRRFCVLRRRTTSIFFQLKRERELREREWRNRREGKREREKRRKKDEKERCTIDCDRDGAVWRVFDGVGEEVEEDFCDRVLRSQYRLHIRVLRRERVRCVCVCVCVCVVSVLHECVIACLRQMRRRERTFSSGSLNVK